MKIPSNNKIFKQVQEYVRKNAKSLSDFSPEYEDLCRRIKEIKEKYRYIQESCEASRKTDKECTCYSHPDHEEFNSQISPLLLEKDLIFAKFQSYLTGIKISHMKFLMRGQRAKQKYEAL